jgi:hypothetical protein
MYVRFAGDNDYINTVRAFVEAIAPKVLFDTWRDISKEEIVELFNNHAFSLYALHQCWVTHADERLRSYLKIEVKDVYFDEEIDEFTNYNNDGCLAAVEYQKIGYYIM